MHRFLRTEWLVGKEGIEKLNQSKVAVFGIGGVGSYVVEALARSGVGNLVLIDSAKVHLTNLNRQIHATEKTLNRPKVSVMGERIKDINPDARVKLFEKFILPGEGNEIFEDNISYIVDAVDTVAAKIYLVVTAKERGIPIISSMGTGNKLDPTKFEVSDIYSTSVCPLAKVMRKELRKRGIQSLKVVYSKETPIKPVYTQLEEEPFSKRVPGSIAFVPSVAGLIIASEVVKDLIS